MLKNLLLALAMLLATMSMAFAQVDANKADQAALQGVKGVGPKTAQQILGARSKGGAFKDWADFEKRVKGVGDKRAAKLSAAGLTVNGQPAPKVALGAKPSKHAAKDAMKSKAGAK
jgi:competence protein ComEA